MSEQKLATEQELILEAIQEAFMLFQKLEKPLDIKSGLPIKELTEIVDNYAFHIKALNRKPSLGLATTRQLLAEITARIDVDGQLDYKTVQK